MKSSDWLSLSEVAQILGVHPGTVRNWSNRGMLPVHRTQGGHRRYRRVEVELWMQSQRAEAASEFDLVIQNALRNIRLQISEGKLSTQIWYNKLDEEAREQYRQSGRAMLQGMIGYLSMNGERAEAEAHALGYEYASRSNRYGLNIVEAAHAFFFFRDMLIESMLKAYEAAAIRSPYAWSNMFRKINTFTEKILISLLETYQVYRQNNS